MTHNRNLLQIISASLVLAIVTIGAISNQQALNVYLKIDGVKGEGAKIHKVVTCSDGTCAAGRLPIGNYKVSVCWVEGGKTAMDDWSQITKMAANTKGAPTSSTVTVTSKPQNSDAAMTTGKRMHKPFSITKEVDKASPLFFSVAAGDVDGDGMVDIMLTCRKAGGNQ